MRADKEAEKSPTLAEGQELADTVVLNAGIVNQKLEQMRALEASQ
ncbi:hypothetical protein JCM19239_3967 [Vibrio variabilis]|uniref:Uncharacterized protein n=1 Tax=Vibrio variabilis TaxID=990271 RepID=A0ABQ0J663_9VIBR|nr:hypothetical protein JCM19239_3967 [Vibrio variabilis]